MDRKTLDEKCDALLERILCELEETLTKSKNNLHFCRTTSSDYLECLDKISRIAFCLKCVTCRCDISKEES